MPKRRAERAKQPAADASTAALEAPAAPVPLPTQGGTDATGPAVLVAPPDVAQVVAVPAPQEAAAGVGSAAAGLTEAAEAKQCSKCEVAKSREWRKEAGTGVSPGLPWHVSSITVTKASITHEFTIATTAVQALLCHNCHSFYFKKGRHKTPAEVAATRARLQARNSSRLTDGLCEGRTVTPRSMVAGWPEEELRERPKK
jgi:hypothetical protein